MALPLALTRVIFFRLTTISQHFHFICPTRNPRFLLLTLTIGALLFGKVNLDQLATGLNGCRSPFGITHSVFSDKHISGGSSSGSCVSVGANLVTFSLATDTAGSGKCYSFTVDPLEDVHFRAQCN